MKDKVKKKKKEELEDWSRKSKKQWGTCQKEKRWVRGQKRREKKLNSG